MFTCAPKKPDTFSSFRPGHTVTKYCACHPKPHVSLKIANQKSQRTVNAMQNEPCSLAHLQKPDTFSSFRPGQTVTKYCACHAIPRVSLKVANQKSQRTVTAMEIEPCSLAHLQKRDTFSSFRPGQTVTKYCACHAKPRAHLRSLAHLKGAHLRT